VAAGGDRGATPSALSSAALATSRSRFCIVSICIPGMSVLAATLDLGTDSGVCCRLESMLSYVHNVIQPILFTVV